MAARGGYLSHVVFVNRMLLEINLGRPLTDAEWARVDLRSTWPETVEAINDVVWTYICTLLDQVTEVTA